MILQILKPQKNTDAHRPDPVRLVPAIRMYQNADSPEATCGRAEPGQWMRGKLQIKTALAPRAALLSGIPLIHRGVPRQVATGGVCAPGVRPSGVPLAVG